MVLYNTDLSFRKHKLIDQLQNKVDIEFWESFLKLNSNFVFIFVYSKQRLLQTIQTLGVCDKKVWKILTTEFV